MAANPKAYHDNLGAFQDGVNSDLQPVLLPKTTLAFLINGTVRGSYIRPRPPFQVKTLDFGGNSELETQFLTGFFQGGGYYKPDFGPESIICQISGRLFRLTPLAEKWIVTDISVPGDLNDATTAQVWMNQSEKWMIVTDGSQKLPIFYDGAISRRSYGPSILLGTTSVNFTPSNPRVIGEVISLTLSAPYTGPFNVPVLFNGEYYQPIENPSVTPTYKVKLTLIYTPNSGVVPIGSNVTVEPQNLGYLRAITNIVGGTYSNFYAFFGLYVVYSGTGSVTVNDNISVPRLFNINQLYSTTTPSGFFLGVTLNGTYPSMYFNAGTNIQRSGKAPTVILGKTISSFSPPAIGSSVEIELDQPYSGANGQQVFLNGGHYTIDAVPPPAPTTLLSMINLTDTSIAVVVAPSDILSVPELPAGRMGAYGLSHQTMSLTDGISFIYGDTLGGPSGTPANNYRDSVLKTTENDFLVAQGAFRIPGSGELITSMTFTATLDTSLGQGPLQLGTSSGMFSCDVPPDRAIWAALTSPILTQSLKGMGPLAQDSTRSVNSDVLFRSTAGLGSLILARRDFNNQWSNTTISAEMNRVFEADNLALLSYSTSTEFDNRYLHACHPQSANQGVFHEGIVVMNLDPLSSMRGKLPACYDGLWTGINTLKLVSGMFESVYRSFAFTYNITENKIELYELLPSASDQKLDNGSVRTPMIFETPMIFHPEERKTEDVLVRLNNGQIWVKNIYGEVHVRVMYRPDFWPCWVDWTEFDLCATDDSKPGYATPVGLGEPPNSQPDLKASIRPFRIGRFFQLRFEITGPLDFMGADFEAIAEPTVSFAPPKCKIECQDIECNVPDDFAYNLQGRLPPPTSPVNNPTFFNDTVYYSVTCETGEPTYDGTLPAWITIDVPNSRLVGAAGTFVATTSAAANVAAQNAMNDFAVAALASGDLNCGGVAPSCVEGDETQYQISPYVDGDVANPGGSSPVGGETVWDGTFAFKTNGNPCGWQATYFGGPAFLMDSLVLCNTYVYFDGSAWRLEFYNENTGLLWSGVKNTGTNPAGIYSRTGGPDATPASLTVTSIGGSTTDQGYVICGPS